MVEVLTAFDHGYRMHVGLGIAPHYERIALPITGGVLDQPARLIEALEIVERISNEELHDTVKHHQADGGSGSHDPD